MFNVERFLTYINPVLDWYFKHGGEGTGPGNPGIEYQAREASLSAGVPWGLAVKGLIAAASAKEVAMKLPDGAQRAGMLRGANAAIETVFDDYCGTPPRRQPWPWPGPPPWTWDIVSSLSVFANGLAQGVLREEVLTIAGQLTGRATGIQQARREQ